MELGGLINGDLLIHTTDGGVVGYEFFNIFGLITSFFFKLASSTLKWRFSRINKAGRDFKKIPADGGTILTDQQKRLGVQKGEDRSCVPMMKDLENTFMASRKCVFL